MAINLTAEKIGSWKLFHHALLVELEKLPFLDDRHAQLAAFIQQAERLQLQQLALRAELQDLNRQRYELALEGDDLCRRLGAAMQAHLGFKNERLIGFGIKPRPRTRRRRKTREEAPEGGAE
ncbi:MAG TPA: hypothetical protein VE078_07400 [Thermoanaerobaculia bacterium]|nr:hypothetical protein [Thermoanaerobaculia bacterium]